LLPITLPCSSPLTKIDNIDAQEGNQTAKVSPDKNKVIQSEFTEDGIMTKSMKKPVKNAELIVIARGV